MQAGPEGLGLWVEQGAGTERACVVFFLPQMQSNLVQIRRLEFFVLGCHNTSFRSVSFSNFSPLLNRIRLLLFRQNG